MLDTSIATRPLEEPEDGAYLIFDGRIVFETPEHVGITERVRRQAWANKKGHLVPDLTEGPYDETLPWPSLAHFNALEAAAGTRPFWETAEFFYQDYVVDATTPAGRERQEKAYRPLWTLVLCAIAVDPAGAQALRMRMQRMPPRVVREGAAGVMGRGEATENLTPGLVAMRQGYGRSMAKALNGRYYPLNQAMTNALSTPGVTIESPPSPEAYGEALLRYTDPAHHASFFGAINPMKYVAPKNAAVQEELRIPLFVSGPEGFRFMVVLDGYYNTKGLMLADDAFKKAVANRTKGEQPEETFMKSDPFFKTFDVMRGRLQQAAQPLQGLT